MRKIFMIGMALTVSLAMLLTSCKKEKVNNNGNNNGNAEDLHSDQVLPNAVTDIDGNSYDAVQLGNQVWMAENLRTTKYADGTSIPMGTSTSTTIAYRYAPGLEESSNEEHMANVVDYGYLYNWSAVMHGASSSEANPCGVQGICPNGWHVPSDAEWTQLTDYLKTQPEYTASGNADHLAKALAATWGWNSSYTQDTPSCDPSTNNATGFSALPAGAYFGFYDMFGYGACFWSSTVNYDSDAYIYGRTLYYINTDVDRLHGSTQYAFSVRCVRD